MRFKLRSPCLILAALVLLFLPAAAMAQVAVYAEGAYTATDLVVYIFADITGSPLCSYGVTLSYQVSKVTSSSATKNEDVWYFGTASVKEDYMEPLVNETINAEHPMATITFIGGKLDTGSPTAGVIGSRVLLGKAVFARVAGQDTAFGITLDLGKPHPDFDNFVTTGTAVYDGTAALAFGPIKINARGDANADGNVTPADMIAVRNAYYGGTVPANSIAADCNADGNITPADMICIRNKYYAP